MKIAVIAPISKGTEIGGAENFYSGLIKALKKNGHEVEKISILVDETTFDSLLEAYLYHYELDVSDFELVISTKAPSYMVKHPNHVSYLLHTVRVFYDLFEHEYGKGNPQLFKQRKIIHTLDKYGLHPNRVKKHFVIGESVYQRMVKTDSFWGKISFEVLYPPPSFSNFLEPQSYSFILLPGRLHRWKRPDLVIKAMEYIDFDIKLKVVGAGEDEQIFRQLASHDSRIEFLGRVTDEELLILYANALVIPFVPINEDYGLITIESFRSKKPVITCVDSGEPTKFVKNFETGFIVNPSPKEIAEKIIYFIKNRSEAERMGYNGYRLVKDISWENTINRLLLAVREKTAKSLSHIKKHPKILATDIQILEPPIGGGRSRIYNLLRNLPKEYEIIYIGTFDWLGPEYREIKITDNFKEIDVPMTVRHLKVDNIFSRLCRNKVTLDATSSILLSLTPRYLKILEREIKSADLIIVSHPWVFPYIKKLTRFKKLPIIYDSQNFEYKIKKEILAQTFLGKILTSLVKKTERFACAFSNLIFVSSEEDGIAYQLVYKIPKEKIALVPNGVMTDEIKPVTTEEKILIKKKLGINNQRTILFVGSGGYEPNTEAVSYICNELALSLPQYLFLIIGGAGDSYLQACKNRNSIPKNVKLYGIVDEETKRNIYNASDIAINPMFKGSGTNIKMFDYLAAGLPTISTPVGARGIEAENGKDFIVCKAEEFKIAIENVFKNEELFKTLSINGRKLAEEKYDWKKIANKASKIIENVIQSL